MKKAKTIRKYNRIITFPIDTKNCKVSINNIILCYESFVENITKYYTKT